MGGEKHHLPLVGVEAHTTILRTTSETTLKQTFINTFGVSIRECVYSFPLFDGVSVVGFTCRVGPRTLRGIVKGKRQAEATYDRAIARGETAGLLEQLPEASDAFNTSLGNVPPRAKILVEINYIGELKHDAEADGIRWTLPTKIAPRYGYGPKTLKEINASGLGGISITVDVDVGNTSHIVSLRSPSHAIAVTEGKFPKSDERQSHRSSATLSPSIAQLDRDFVLIVSYKHNGYPTAFLETHSSIPNQRALMVDLVPKFRLLPNRPEIIFVADRSGTMRDQIPTLKSALRTFVKSLPFGAKFNILSFGSECSFLWPKSKGYTNESVTQAMEHIETFSSNMGGTRTYAAIRAAIEKRFPDICCEILLLTDGDIWDQQELFDYLNETVSDKVRVFTLGIGSQVSSALIEGVARAGKGFAQTVIEGETMDKKVVRMLKGALSPHISGLTMEVKYGSKRDMKQDDTWIKTGVKEIDSDWEVVEKVEDGLKLLNLEEDKNPKPRIEQKTISLYDPDLDTEEQDVTEMQSSGECDEVGQYAHLPNVTPPKLLQAPCVLPPLFPFSRTTFYLLMSPESNRNTPVDKVILRGNSPQGPLELEIPVQQLDMPGKKLHQLAAKKAIQELEEGRGWLLNAKNGDDTPLKDRYPSCFGEMVQREAVRLGVQYQIVGKYCSSVAVADNAKNSKEVEVCPPAYKMSFTEPPSEACGDSDEDMGFGLFEAPTTRSAGPTTRRHASNQHQASGREEERFDALGCKPAIVYKDEDLGSGNSRKNVRGLRKNQSRELAAVNLVSANLHGQTRGCDQPADGRGDIGFAGRGGSGPIPTSQTRSHGPLTGSLPSTSAKPTKEIGKRKRGEPWISDESSDDSSDDEMTKHSRLSRPSQSGPLEPEKQSTSTTPTKSEFKRQKPTPNRRAIANLSLTDKVHHLISLQSFSGYWSFSKSFPALLNTFSPLFNPEHPEHSSSKPATPEKEKVWITIYVVRWLELVAHDEQELWELIVEKARYWLEDERKTILKADGEELKAWEDQAKGLIEGLAWEWEGTYGREGWEDHRLKRIGVPERRREGD